jgi:hypothetical protein
MNAARVGGAAGTHAVGGIVQPADAVAKPPVRIKLPVSTPKRRNRVVLDRGDGRQWTPPPTAREITQADPMTRSGVKGMPSHRRCVKQPGKRVKGSSP